jgi:hypothetical protein
MTRFPFEEDPRHRFGEFEEWKGRYIFIGRYACGDPVQPEETTVRQPIPRRMRDHRATAARPAEARQAAIARRRQG